MELRGSLVKKPEILESKVDSETVRYLEHEMWGKIKLVRYDKCCVCHEHVWCESKSDATVAYDHFKVIDSRAYVGGTPDFIKNSNVLLDCHNECLPELKEILNKGMFLTPNIPAEEQSAIVI